MLVWAMLLGGLIIGTFAGWMLCALITMSVNCAQIDRLGRLRYTVQEFLRQTEKYHDDLMLARLRTYANDLLEQD